MEMIMTRSQMPVLELLAGSRSVFIHHAQSIATWASNLQAAVLGGSRAINTASSADDSKCPSAHASLEASRTGSVSSTYRKAGNGKGSTCLAGTGQTSTD
jgi:hypothetical protein